MMLVFPLETGWFLMLHCVFFRRIQICIHKLQARHYKSQLVTSGFCVWNVCFPLGLGKSIHYLIKENITYDHLVCCDR